MSDFGELCPLFNTGVYRELMFPNIALSLVTACGNALVGTLTASASGNFSFGRTVVVTAAWLRKTAAPSSQVVVHLRHHSSRLAAGTIFATLTVSVTATGMEVGYGYVPMNVSTETTFTSAAILGLGVAAGSDSTKVDLLIRYKEK